jgi:phosphoserine phosphatase RsbU/P
MLLSTTHATHRGTMFGVPGVGHQVENRQAFIFSFHGDHIASEVRWYSVGQLAESLEKARTDLELKVAGEVQRALLPRTRHGGDYFEAVGASLACRAIGGDFFEYVDLPSGDFGLAIGDVSGKGPAAALLASMLQGIFSVESEGGHTPSTTLGRTNRALLRRGIEPRFATLVYGVLSPDGRFVYSNAGHNPPLLLKAGNAQRLQVGGPILGVFGDAAFEEETLQLDAGDTVILYTDGITEAFNGVGDEFGEHRLVSFATMHRRTPSELVDGVFAAVVEFCRDAAQSDDVTMMAMRFR